jgi:quercetin dioxygenase-like cupin family protein
VRTLDVGDVLLIPAEVIHSATNTGAGNEANS